VERQAEADATVRALAALVGSAVDLDAVLAVARGAGPLTVGLRVHGGQSGSVGDHRRPPTGIS
jgi:hypothetical protein